MQELVTHPFTNYLLRLRDHENEAYARASLAILRRGLGHEPGEVREMYPYIFPYLPTTVRANEEKLYFLMAALFALHPGERRKKSDEEQAEATGNMGDHFAEAVRKEKIDNPESKGESIERRFTALLAAHPDDLPFHLRHAVSYLEAKTIEINWHQLFFDAQRWRNQETQKRWARTFWGQATKEPTPTEL